MKKLFLSFCLLFTFAVTSATNVTVNNYSALVAEVAGNADTIYVDGNIVVSFQIIRINRNLVFVGINNGTLDYNNQSRKIEIAGINKKVAFHNLTFINGVSYGDVYGGVFIVDVIDNLTVKDCKFFNNTAPWGGAIYGKEIKYMLLENCEFRNNRATEVGGAIWVEGAGASIRTGNLYVVNCLFDSNSATMATGALDTHNWLKVTVFNTSFTNNTSGSTDPGVFCVGNNAQTNVINCTFAKNHSYGNAGAIGLWMSEHLNVYNCVMTGNTTPFDSNDISNTPQNSAASVIKMYNTAYNQIRNPLILSTNTNNFSNIQQNTTFVDFLNNNFSLLNGSEALNSGSEADYVTQWNLNFPQNTITSPTDHTDVDGNSRSICNIDMGAYEGNYPIILPFSDDFCESYTYNFRGKILTEKGTYCDTTVSNINCDTIYKLNLTKLETKRYAYRDTSYKCEYYYFGGKNLNETNIYVDTVPSSNGCDSIVTLDLLVRPREFDDTLNICAENLPYGIYDTVFSSTAVSGTYVIHHRCAVITLRLNVQPKPQTLPPNVPQICADDGSFILKFSPSSAQHTKQPTNYEIIFDDKAVTAGFENQSGTFDNNYEVTVQMPQKIYPDYYNCRIIFSDNINNCVTQTFDIELPVLYPDSVMQQKWDDVIALLNFYYNGGFEYIGYQWYKNNIILPYETSSYIFLGEKKLMIGDEYSVLLTRKDGSKLMSCPFVPHEPRVVVSAFPTLVSANSVITIHTYNGYVQAKLWTISGVLLQEGKISSNALQLTAPSSAGIYLLELSSNDNQRDMFKIVVTK